MGSSKFSGILDCQTVQSERLKRNENGRSRESFTKVECILPVVILSEFRMNQYRESLLEISNIGKTHPL